MNQAEPQKGGALKRIQSNPNHILAIISVLIIALLCQSSSVEAPALQYIANAFPSVPMTTITMISTLPSLFMIPAALLYPLLRRRMGARKMFVLCLVLLVVGGVLPAYAGSVAAILVWRAVFGVGVGLVWPLTQSLIIELYSGTRQNTMLGLNSVVTGVGGVIWANLGGYLALTSWRHSFYAYLLAGIIMAAALLFLPEPATIQEKLEDKLDDLTEDASQSKGKVTSTAGAVFLLICMALVSGTNMIFFTNVSLKVVGEGLGNSVTAGLAQSMFTIGATVMGLIFGLLMKNKFMRKWGFGLSWVLLGAGLMIFATGKSLPVMFAGELLHGFATGLFMPAVIGMLGNIQGKEKAPFWLAIMNCLNGLTQFGIPWVLNKVTTLSGNSYGAWPMTVAASIHFVCAVIAIIVIASVSKKGKSFAM